MSSKTSIEWTRGDDGAPGMTWNPTTGCDRISPGCDHCYALTLAKRLKAMGSAKYQTDGDPRTSGPGFGVATHSDALTEPMRWRKPRKVFVNSMSDLFHARVSREFVSRVFAVMAVTPQHTYQVLTKRPERMARILADESFKHAVALGMVDLTVRADDPTSRRPIVAWPLPNVWMGTSIESDEYVKRADALRATPAAVRFISAEPLLGPLSSLDLTGIDWLIAGGESGPNARPVDPAWIRDLRDRCQASGTAFVFKQWGGRTPKTGGRELDGRTWDEYPAGAA
jgi:protein gp37